MLPSNDLTVSSLHKKPAHILQHCCYAESGYGAFHFRILVYNLVGGQDAELISIQGFVVL